MTLTTEHRAEWRRLAEAATNGPWEAFRGKHGRTRVYWDVVTNTGTVAEMPGDGREPDKADAAYIAHSSPDRILALLDERDALEKQAGVARQITFCTNCGANWCDDGNNNPECPYCLLRHKIDALEAAEQDRAQARGTSQFHKDNHLAAESEIDTLRQQLAASESQVQALRAERDAAHKAVSELSQSAHLEWTLAQAAEARASRLETHLERIAIEGVTAGASPQRDGTMSPPLWHMKCRLCGTTWSKQQREQPRQHPPHAECPLDLTPPDEAKA